MARKIQVEIVGDSKSVERAFARSGKAADNFQGKVVKSTGAIGRKMAYLGGAAAGLAIVLGVKSVKAASNLGEQINKTNVVFGKGAKMIQRFARTTASSFGISNEKALEFAGIFGNMFVPMGISRQKAAVLSKGLVKLAADMASFNNASPEEVLLALQSGLSGQIEPLRRYGIFLDQDRILAEALSQGLVKMNVDSSKVKLATIKVADAQKDYTDALKKHGIKSEEAQTALAKLEYSQSQLSKALGGTRPKLTAQQKALATLGIITKDTKDAHGDFGRTLDTSLPNAIRVLKAQLTDLEAAFGKGLTPVVNRAAQMLRKKLADPQVRANVARMGHLVGVVLLKAFTGIAKWFKTHWEGIKNGLRTAKDITATLADAFRTIATLTPGGPETLIGLIVSGVLLSKLKTLAMFVGTIGGAGIGGKGKGKGKGGIPGGIPILNPVTATAAAVVSAAGGGTQRGDRSGQYPLTYNAVRAAARGNLGPRALAILKDALDNYSLANAPDKKMRESERRLRALYAQGGSHGKRKMPGGGYQPGRASGGPVMAGMAYTVGERGPETFVPSSNGNIIPNGSGGMNINGPIYVTANNPKQFLSELQRLAKRGASQQRGRLGGQNLALS